LNAWRPPAPEGWREAVAVALAEDLGPGDVSAHLWDDEPQIHWRIAAQQEGVACGVGVAHYLLGGTPTVSDGDLIGPGTTVLAGEGGAAFVLARERVALNFLMHLSGVASHTRLFVALASPARVCDTRKTIPGIRALQKYAVRCGGGTNHRMGLYDGLMIKDNHIAAFGGVAEAVCRARARVAHTLRIEVECDRPDQVDEAVEAGADIVLLDNMDPATMRACVDRHRGRCLFEASGGVNLESIAAIAASGVDFVSVGALTHSSPALALHLEVDRP
jgi:nicotinate-nucleotide pyrophosphorylase (carboxylating)